MALKQTTIVLTLAAFSLGQRPSFAGFRPIGYPEITTTTSASALGNRFGEGDATTTTQRLPLEALGDRDLVDRLSKLPKDKQPFWLLNWQALEANRKNPQSYPQRPSQFAASLEPLPNTQNPNLNTNTGSELGNRNSDVPIASSNSNSASTTSNTASNNPTKTNVNSSGANSNSPSLNPNIASSIPIFDIANVASSNVVNSNSKPPTTNPNIVNTNVAGNNPNSAGVHSNFASSNSGSVPLNSGNSNVNSAHVADSISPNAFSLPVNKNSAHKKEGNSATVRPTGVVNHPVNVGLHTDHGNVFSSYSDDIYDDVKFESGEIPYYHKKHSQERIKHDSDHDDDDE